MKRGLILTGKLILILAILAVLCIPSTVLAKKYNLTVQSAFPRGDVSVPLLQVFADTANKESNGDIKIEWFGAPEIVPPEQLMDAVKMSSGVDMLQAVGAYWAGTMPIGDVEFALPMAYAVPWEDSYANKAKALREFFYSSGYIDIIRAEYAKHGLYYIDIITAPMAILSTKPLKSLDDFKGVKIRADGLNVEFYNLAGMQATTSIPGTESYLALKLGTIGAAEWDISAITALKWYEAAPNWVQGIDTLNVMSVAMNKDTYDSMNDVQKAAIKKAGQAYWDAAIVLYEGEIKEADKLIAAGKLQKVMPDQSAIDIFHNGALKLWDQAGSRDEASKKAVELLKAWNEKGIASMKK